ncbi:hypothetical protein BC941DRAFT_424572 [Chlamydoabsidia padenii]|nr:hypothetical protein BC941DRAFT_424572 [Chlamydoabsidia padenii]
MTQHSSVLPSPSDKSNMNGRGTRSKHFLSRFLANSTPVYVYDDLNSTSLESTCNNQNEHNKVKKNKGIGRRMLERFTTKSDNRGSANWNNESPPPAQRHSSTPTVTTNVSTPVPGRNLDYPTPTTNKNRLTGTKDKATSLEKAKRRRSATLPSVMYTTPPNFFLTPATTTTAKSDTTMNSHLEQPTALNNTTSSHHNETEIQQPQPDLEDIANNVIKIKIDNSSDNDGDDSSDESYVDASEELDLEPVVGNKSRASLTKRLSAGHFGSAGGLVVNMRHSLRNQPSRQSMVQQLRNSPPPDDLAKVMLDWKRKSVGDGTIDKRFSSDIAKSDQPPTAQADDDPELSKEDKEALRAHTESILMGNDRVNTSPPGHLHHERSRSIKALSEMFSKTLDEAWNSDDVSSNLSHQMRDPRLSTAWTRPAELSTRAKETAKRIWNCDESFLPVDRYAEWLGQLVPYNAETLVCYMDLFYFTGMKLDSAFRKLCSKLYFKAEAQQIDRILEVFAHRFWDCNPNSEFKCPDVVYAVVYSLLLLNTDLHVAQGNHHRMSKQDFIKNTMLAIHSQLRLHSEITYSSQFDPDMERYLKEIYMSVKNYQILQPLSDEHWPATHCADTKTGNTLRHVESLKRGVSSMIRKAGRESMMMANNDIPIMPRPSSPLSTPSRSSIYHSSLSNPAPPPRISTTTASTSRRLSRSISLRQASSLTASGKYHSNESMTSIGSSITSSLDGSTTDNTRQSRHDTINSGHRNNSALSPILFTPGTYFQDAPFAKESVVMCKHLLKSSNHKAKSREWKEQLMVVDDQGVMKLYDIPGQRETDRITQGSIELFRHTHGRNNTRKHIQGPLSKFDPSWNDLLVLTIDLKHTLSNVLPPPGYNKMRQHVFAFQQPNGGVYLFQGTSLDDVTSWVLTCNYWAARQSKEPLQGGVGNMDYGWGECLHTVIVDLDAIQNGDVMTGNTVGGGDADSLVIYDWQPPVAPAVASQHTDDPTRQLDALNHHLRWLHSEINAHRDIKTKMLVRFPNKRSFNYKRALSNWTLKSSYLLGDIIKYQHYCDALEQSLQLASSDNLALDHVALIDLHDMDLIKEIEDELDLQ